MSVSTRTRFEVFKRDGFTCRYCGRKTPDVVLHVDHIVAVANGGPDDIANLITACADCNLGKSSVPLEESSRPMPDLTRTEEIREREEQLRAYNAARGDERTRRNNDFASAIDYWRQLWQIDYDAPYYMPRDNVLTKHIELLGVEEVKDAMDVTHRRFNGSIRTDAVRYFGGVLKHKAEDRKPRG